MSTEALAHHGQVVAETTLSELPFLGPWEMTFISVAKKHLRRGYGTRLYHWAKAYAEERKCRLLPSPDLTWDEFAFWRAMDPEALFEVLNDEGNLELIEDNGGDTERFQKQLSMLEEEMESRVDDTT